MLLFLKKLLSRPFFPISLGLELLVAGIVFWGFTKRRRLGQVLVVAGTVWFGVIGYDVIPRLLSPPLTEQNPPLTDAQLRAIAPEFIVVPGMGVYNDTRYAANLRFPGEFIFRLLEAIRIHRQCPNAQILVSISDENMTAAEKQSVFGEFLRLLQVDPSKATMITGLRDTEEEIMEFKRRAGDRRVCLVSSAMNLPRAMILARRHGLNASPSPSSKGGYPRDPNLKQEFLIVHVFPSAEAVANTELVFYEYLGLALERFKGAFRAAKDKAVDP